MTQANVKKPPVQGKKPAGTPQKVKPQAAKPSKPPTKPTMAQQGQKPTTVVPPPAPKEQIAQRTYKQVIWQDDNDVDFEDITFALPIIISIAVLLLFVIRKYVRWNTPCPSDSRLEGKTVLVTGANTGLGKATATELARRGAKVILGCRDKPRGDAVALNIRGKTNNLEVYCYHLDLASMSDIKSFVEDFNQRESCLHVLVNNAAYMGPKATTVDHYERTFGVNFLGHFYLTYLLQDKLKKGAPSRIINVISDSYSKGKLNFDDLSMADYDIYKAYARSKMAQVVFTHELHSRFSRDCIFSYGVHPGMVHTDLMRNWPGLTGNFMRLVAKIFFMSPEEGCQSIVFAAVSDKIRNQSGKFFTNCSHMKVKAATKEKDIGEKLWNTALHLCGMESEIVYNDNQDGGKPVVEDVSASETKKDK